MKHAIAVLLVLLLAQAVLAPAQTKRNGPAQGTGATAQALIALENKWVDALMKSDTATLDSNFKGEALVPKIIFTDTFVKQNGKWMAVASHRSPAA